MLSNYRPISVLPIFSKIFEKVVYNRLITYFNKYDILFKNQYGFRKGHSTSLALHHLFDNITKAIDQKEYTIAVFIDLSNAFDMVNHEILINKLKHYGIRGLSLDWIKSYFGNRQQYVEYNGAYSSYNSIKCGVPQGSILGPLLFLIYINDLCNASNIVELILFADDTNIFFSHNNLPLLMNIINSEMNKLSEWFRANKLSINAKKSSLLLMNKRRKVGGSNCL
jgi:retron-type reverse transcriptase